MAKKEIDKTTEEKIIEAARKVFIQKGYAATRTRDIAEEAGINLALLNYYYRSKEKLFSIIMAEKVNQFFSIIFQVVNNDCLSLDEKIEQAAENYTELLVQNPDISLFVLNEIKSDPDSFKNRHHVQQLIKDSSLMRQIVAVKPGIDPLHFLVTMLGMTIFPSVARSVIFDDMERYRSFMLERKTLIALWMKSLLSV